MVLCVDFFQGKKVLVDGAEFKMSDYFRSSCQSHDVPPVVPMVSDTRI